MGNQHDAKVHYYIFREMRSGEERDIELQVRKLALSYVPMEQHIKAAC